MSEFLFRLCDKTISYEPYRSLSIPLNFGATVGEFRRTVSDSFDIPVEQLSVVDDRDNDYPDSVKVRNILNSFHDRVPWIIRRFPASDKRRVAAGLSVTSSNPSPVSRPVTPSLPISRSVMAKEPYDERVSTVVFKSISSGLPRIDAVDIPHNSTVRDFKEVIAGKYGIDPEVILVLGSNGELRNEQLILKEIYENGDEYPSVMLLPRKILQ